MIIVVRPYKGDNVVINTDNSRPLIMADGPVEYWDRVADVLTPWIEENSGFEFIDTDSCDVVDLSVYKHRGQWAAHTIKNRTVLVTLYDQPDRIMLFRSILNQTFFK